MPRFLQLFLLASMVLLLPSLFYLSREKTPYIPSEDVALMQTSQGHGPEPAPVDASVEQSWRWGADKLGSLKESAGKLFEAAKNKETDTWRAGNGSTSNSDKAKAKSGSANGGAGLDGLDATKGGAIMGKMANETAKAELGRATWKFLHTMTLRFPDHPTEAERESLKQFFHLFSRLYPCGECASHFQQLLKELPPQTSSRMSSALWLCAAHNKVNQRLGKPEFPCDKLDETYDCGCGDDKAKDGSAVGTTGEDTAATAAVAAEAVANSKTDAEMDRAKHEAVVVPRSNRRAGKKRGCCGSGAPTTLDTLFV